MFSLYLAVTETSVKTFLQFRKQSFHVITCVAPFSVEKAWKFILHRDAFHLKTFASENSCFSSRVAQNSCAPKPLEAAVAERTASADSPVRHGGTEQLIRSAGRPSAHHPSAQLCGSAGGGNGGGEQDR